MENEVSGVLVTDKPPGMSSARLVAEIKRRLKVRKAGHSGTLDPFATGVMVVCINQATRLASYFLHGDKTYQGVLHLGISTDTQDFTGTVTSACEVPPFPEQMVKDAFLQFVGTIDQIPPVFSALKHQGVPLYRLARKGRPVTKPSRKVIIHRITILEINLPEVRFEVNCSAGTYIRTLCSDVGAALRCGGHLKALCRTRSGGFCLEDAVGFDDMTSMAESGDIFKRLIPMEKVVDWMPSVRVDTPAAGMIRQGRTEFLKTLTPGQILFPSPGQNQPVKVMDESGALVAILEKDEMEDNYRYRCVFH